MMRKKIAIALVMTLFLTAFMNPVISTQAYTQDDTKQIVDAAGIMNTDQGTNDDAAKTVTRDRFAQMLVNASSLRGTVSGESSITLFSDVKKSYWAAGYIESVVKQGFMSGYLNGKFKPTQGITLQEAVYAVCRLLGYSNTDFNGGISTGMMKLYQSKGLNTGISKKNTQYLSVEDCYHLFYNTLTTTTKDGGVYAVKLGYQVNSYGVPDYLSIVNSDLKGPMIVDGAWQEKLPFSVGDASFYLDGNRCTINDISNYDVLYYLKSTKTVYAYDYKVTGTIDSVNPDNTAPQSIIISGKTYNFADSSAALRFSSMGDIRAGDIVTLILDKNNAIVDALCTDEYDASVTGIVTGTGTHLAEMNGTYMTTGFVTFVDAAGYEHQQDYDLNAITFVQGDMAKVTYTDGVASIQKLNAGSYSIGYDSFNSDASMLGNYKLAPNVKILDYYNGNYISVSPKRLAGIALSNTICYYTLNSSSELSELILYNVTGDIASYGICKGLTYQNNKLSYNYLIGSEALSYSSDSISDLSTQVGPTGFIIKNNTLTSSFALTGVEVTSIGNSAIQSGNYKYTLAAQYKVYLLVNGSYTLTTLDKVSNLSKYTLTAYYDKASDLGGRVRVIVAESK